MSNNLVTHEQIVRTLGLSACVTLEYYWEDMHFLPNEVIPQRLLEGDDGMQEALLRLSHKTGMARKLRNGWRLNPAVYEAVHDLTPETEKTLYRAELIRHVILGALEKYGLVSMYALSDFFRVLNMPEDVWQEAYGDLFEAAYYEVIDQENDTRYVAHPALEDAGDLLAARHENGVFAVASDPVKLRLSAGWLPEDEDMYFDALEWLSRQGVSPEDGAVLLQNALYALHASGETEDMVAEITEAIGLDEIPEETEAMLSRLADVVPRWAISGISTHELYLMKHPDLSGESPY